MRGHKMAVAPIAQGEPVRKYDQIIGFATQAIAPGDWVHTHNVEMHDFARDYRFAEGARNDEMLPPELRATFDGYVRPGGKTGTRNYIGILTSVNCSASAARFIAREVENPACSRITRLSTASPFSTALAALAAWRGFDAAPDQWLRDARQLARADGRARLRRVPDRPMKDEYGWSRVIASRPSRAPGGTKKTVAEGRAHQGDMPTAARQARMGLRGHAGANAALDGYSNTAPRARRRGGELVVWRHRDPLRDAGNYGASICRRRAVNRGQKLVERTVVGAHCERNGGDEHQLAG